MPSAWRVCLRAALIVCAVSAAAPSARAATLPTGAIVRVGRSVDADSFARLVASRYHIVFRHIVTADIDRDGDIDVLATGDRGLSVWLNDGHGQLRSAPPTSAPGLDGTAPARAWRGSGSFLDDVVQDETPQPSLMLERAHAPPLSPDCRSSFVNRLDPSATIAVHACPRAPPRLS